MDDSYYRDLAERLAAAAVSQQMGNRSIDYTLKTYIRGSEGEIGDYWMQLARKVSHDLVESRQQRLFDASTPKE